LDATRHSLVVGSESMINGREFGQLPPTLQGDGGGVIKPWLTYAIIVYLSAALAEDTVLFVLAWIAPDLWFRLLHASTPAGLEIALLRRSAGQWAAFALAQALALIWWRRKPVWLVIVAGVRFSDLFTDISYILAVPTLTGLGWAVLLPPPFLNLVGVVIMMMGFRQTRGAAA
jgi:hypothetical protein